MGEVVIPKPKFGYIKPGKDIPWWKCMTYREWPHRDAIWCGPPWRVLPVMLWYEGKRLLNFLWYRWRWWVKPKRMYGRGSAGVQGWQIPQYENSEYERLPGVIIPANPETINKVKLFKENKDARNDS